MSEEKVLTKEIAEQFFKQPYPDVTNEFSRIDDDAAELLSKCPGDLFLEGLEKISDASAESLSKHTGEKIDLEGLIELSDAAAESLSKYKGQLYLNHEMRDRLENLPRTLSIEIAKEFLENNASIDLTQFNQLDEDAAHVLSGINAPLRLGLIAELSESAALNLASYCGYYLSIKTEKWGKSMKHNLSYQKLTKLMFENRFENTKNALGKLTDLKGVDEEFVKKIDLSVSNVTSRMNGMDTNESQFLAAYELLFILSSKHLHEVSSVENIEIWRSIVANYGLWVSGNPWKDEAERLRIGEWCNEVWKLSEAINNEITEICEPNLMESKFPSLNYLLCKLREEFLDAKREWGFLEGLPR
jgi:hypothetical protein